VSGDGLLMWFLVALVIGVPVLTGFCWAIYEGVQGALENHHRRKLEIIEAEQKERKEIEAEWDARFNKGQS
jgi:hypothetical protein